MTAANSRHESTPTRVLIVDDDSEFCQVAADLLTDRGYEVVGRARTVREAIAECDRLRPDAVLLDVRLPDGNGLSLAKKLRARGAGPNILLTSTDREMVEPGRLRECGALGFVPKVELARRDLDPFLRR